MTKSTITREQQRQILIDTAKHIIRRERTSPYSENLRELARMALAAMDSEPVAEVCEDYAIRYISSGPAPKEGLHPGDKLYRHAQQPVVPDDVLDALQKVARIRLDLNDFDGDRRGIDDCLGDAEEALIEVVNRRAAMLAAATQEDINALIPLVSRNEREGK